MQVSSIRGDSLSFFMSYVKPQKLVTAQTFARWMQQILTKAGVNPEIWAPHSVRAAASSHHSTARQLDLGQICRLADWSMASSVFVKLYKRYVWCVFISLPVFWILYFLKFILYCAIHIYFGKYIIFWEWDILQKYNPFISLNIYWKWYYTSHLLTRVHIDQGSLSVWHLSKHSWSTFPIFRMCRDLYQWGDCLNVTGLLFP